MMSLYVQTHMDDMFMYIYVLYTYVWILCNRLGCGHYKLVEVCISVALFVEW